MTTPYTPPAPGSAPSSTTGGYNYNPADPYDLGVLAQAPVILAQTATSTTTHQFNYTPGHGPGVLGPGMLAANGVGNDGSDLSNLLSQGIEGLPPAPPAGGVLTPGTTTTHGIGNVAETATQYITDWMRQYSSPKTRAEFTGVRAALANAGYYGTETWQRVGGRAAGLWDITAVKHAIQDWHTYVLSTGAPVTFTEWLTKASGTGTVGGPAKQPAVTLMDPTSIRAAAQSAAQQALGMGLSEKQLDKFVSQFQAAQTSAQSATSGTVTSPDLSGDAMQFAQQENPGAYQANQHDAYLDSLVNLFAPPGSQRPNMTPTPKA